MKDSCTIKNCKGKVTGHYSPDMDIRGLGYCLKHKTLVFGAYCCLTNGDKESFYQLTGEKI